MAKSGHDRLAQYGAAEKAPKGDMQRLVRQLVMQGLLLEVTHRQDNAYGTVVASIAVRWGGGLRGLVGKVGVKGLRVGAC